MRRALTLCALAAAGALLVASGVGARSAKSPRDALETLKAFDVKLADAVETLDAQATAKRKLTVTERRELLNSLLAYLDYVVPDSFGSIDGLSTGSVFARLFKLDDTISSANAHRDDKEALAGYLSELKKGLHELEGLTAKGKDVPPAVGEQIGKLSSDASALAADAAAGKLDDAKIAARLGALRDAKVFDLGGAFGSILGVRFPLVYLNWERVRNRLRDAVGENEVKPGVPGPLGAVVHDIESAIAYKKALEKLIADANPTATIPTTNPTETTTTTGNAATGSGRLFRDCASYPGGNADPGCDDAYAIVSFDVAVRGFHLVLPPGWVVVGSEPHTFDPKTKAYDIGIGQCGFATTKTKYDTVLCQIATPPKPGTKIKFAVGGLQRIQSGGTFAGTRPPDGLGAKLYLDSPAKAGPFAVTGP